MRLRQANKIIGYAERINNRICFRCRTGTFKRAMDRIWVDWVVDSSLPIHSMRGRDDAIWMGDKIDPGKPISLIQVET